MSDADEDEAMDEDEDNDTPVLTAEMLKVWQRALLEVMRPSVLSQACKYSQRSWRIFLDPVSTSLSETFGCLQVGSSYERRGRKHAIGGLENRGGQWYVPSPC